MRYLKTRLARLGIMKKFTLCVVICIVIPLVLVLVMINTRIGGNLARQNNQTEMEIFKQTRTALENLFNDTEQLSVDLISDRTMQNYLQKVSREGNAYSKEKIAVLTMMDDLVKSREYVTHASLFTDREILVRSGHVFLGNNDEDILKEVRGMRGKAYWNLSDADEYNRTELSMTRAVNSFYSYVSIVAFIRLCIPEGTVSEVLESAGNRYVDDVLLLTDGGIVISGQDKSLLGKNVSDEPWFAGLEADSGWKTLGDKLICYYRLDQHDWYAVQIMTIRHESAILLANWIFVIAMGLVTLFAAIFMVIEHKTLLQPIVRLTRDLDAYQADGTRDIGLYVTSQDEIGKLNLGITAMTGRIHNLIENEYKSNLREKQAQLQALQMQINPHFLYNTLESIRWMAFREKAPKAASMVETLSRLLRHTLNAGSSETMLKEEVRHVEDYISLQKSRLGDRLVFNIEADPAVMDCRSLALLLQPVVENCIIHGFADKLSTCRIDLTISEQNDGICVRVEDNGMGVDEGEVRQQLDDPELAAGHSALANIQQRLRFRYGERYGLTFQSRINQGTVVTIRFPKEKGVADETADRG